MSRAPGGTEAASSGSAEASFEAEVRTHLPRNVAAHVARVARTQPFKPAVIVPAGLGTSWDCSAAGMTASAGDRLRISVRGSGD